MSYFLRSQRLGFRTWRSGDLDLAMGLWGDPLVTEHIDVRERLTREQVRERLEEELRNLGSCGLQYWPIFLLDTDEHVGCCGLRPRDPERRIYELGFHVRAAHWRRGYAREAAEAAIEHAFGRQRLAALIAGHGPANVAARLLLLDLGFRYTHDEFYPPAQTDHPTYLLTAEEYRRARAVGS